LNEKALSWANQPALWNFSVSYQSIAELNHIANPDLIYPGQVFKIPHN